MLDFGCGTSDDHLLFDLQSARISASRRPGSWANARANQSRHEECRHPPDYPLHAPASQASRSAAPRRSARGCDPADRRFPGRRYTFRVFFAWAGRNFRWAHFRRKVLRCNPLPYPPPEKWHRRGGIFRLCWLTGIHRIWYCQWCASKHFLLRIQASEP